MKRLFYDIETAPCLAAVWKTNRKQWVGYESIIKERAVMCIGFKFQGEKNADVLTWDRNHCDKKMLEKFHKLLPGVHEGVGHNIDKFDLPWIRTRMLIHGFPPPPNFKTADTLQWARRYHDFQSNRLDYIATILGIGCKRKTEYGLWKRAAFDLDPKVRAAALSDMSDYCAHDVELLEKVWERLQLYCPVKVHAGVLNGSEKWSCPRCASENVIRWSKFATAAGTIRNRMKCKSCMGSYTVSEATAKQYDERVIDR